MKKIFLLFFLFCVAAPAYSQSVLGQLGCDTIKELTTTVNVNQNPIIIINSPVPNLRVESKNRNIIKRVEETQGRWAIIVPPGTHKLVFDAKGFERLELENFVFAKSRTYEVRIFSARAPHNVVELAGKGSITIQTIPEEASIALDGIPGEWKSPAIIKNIIAATYTITVYKQNYDSLVFTANVIQDSTTQLPLVKLVPQFGFLKIGTDKGAKLVINNEAEVFSSDTIITLPRGNHSLVLEKPQYQTISKEIVITSGDTTIFQQALVANFSYFDFSKFSTNATIMFDGRTVPPRIYKTTPGVHIVAIENAAEGKLKLSKSFSVEPGAIREIRETDVWDPGDLVITSDVLAKLFIDDREVALSIEQTIPAGFHTVKLVHPKLGEETRTVQISSNRKSNLFISMLPSRSTTAWLTVFPGVSQMYRGMTIKGLLYIGGFILSAAGSYYFDDQYNQEVRKYKYYVQQYKATTNGTTAAVLNDAIKKKYSQMSDAESQRQLAFGATGAVFLWNIVDSFIFGPRYGYRKRDDSAFNFQIRSKDQYIAMNIHVTF